MADNDQATSVQVQGEQVDDNAGGVAQAGTAKFKTVKAACGIRFDPDTLDEEAGFDFSGAQALKPDLPDSEHNPDENSET